jgi:hypothetical protein
MYVLVKNGFVAIIDTLKRALSFLPKTYPQFVALPYNFAAKNS